MLAFLEAVRLFDILFHGGMCTAVVGLMLIWFNCRRTGITLVVVGLLCLFACVYMIAEKLV